MAHGPRSWRPAAVCRPARPRAGGRVYRNDAEVADVAGRQLAGAVEEPHLVAELAEVGLRGGGRPAWPTARLFSSRVYVAEVQLPAPPQPAPRTAFRLRVGTDAQAGPPVTPTTGGPASSPSRRPPLRGSSEPRPRRERSRPPARWARSPCRPSSAPLDLGEHGGPVFSRSTVGERGGPGAGRCARVVAGPRGG